MKKLAPPGTLTRNVEPFRGFHCATETIQHQRQTSESHTSVMNTNAYATHSLTVTSKLYLYPYSLYPEPRPCADTVLHFNSFTFITYRGSYFQYDSSTSFWNFLAAGNYAARFYRFAMTDVTALQAKLQQESFAAVAAVEEVALRILSTASYNVATARVGELLTKATNEEANKIVGAWRDLLPHLITKYV